MDAARWTGALAFAVPAVLVAGCRVALGGVSEADLVERYRAVHESRDVYAAIRLVHWDESTGRDRGEISKMFEQLFCRKLRSVRTEAISWGGGAGSSVIPVSNLVVECEGTQTQWVFPVGRIGDSYFLAFRVAQ
ncbi:MAG TPA: hypothetical protein VI643_04430 [Planctomycetota bacterium]|nr:hypothetical protein [Planctomycetota bacterium]